jgi:hypothetical protein
VRALADRSVRPERIVPNVLNLHVDETLLRMRRNREFDVAEMSLSSCTAVIRRDVYEANRRIARPPGQASRMCPSRCASDLRSPPASTERPVPR